MPQAGAMPMVRFSWRVAFTSWNFGSFSVFMLAVLVAIAVWYLRAEWKLATRGRRWPASRRIFFLAGLVAVDLAFQSSVAILAGAYFQAHVVQHLLLMVVAPPLLALGAPSTLLLQTASRKTKTRWLGVLRSSPFAVLSHPITVWFLYYGAMFVFFLTSLINVAMWHMDLMDLINVLFLLGGLLFWWPMVGLDPIVHWKMTYPMRMLNILLGTGLEAFLGVAILNQSLPVASMYTLASTHAGGGLLWTSTEIVTLGAFIPIYRQWTKSEDRMAARLDAASERDRARAASEGLSGQIGAATRARPVTAAEAAGLSLWEAEWLRRTGRMPRRDVGLEDAINVPERP